MSADQSGKRIELAHRFVGKRKNSILRSLSPLSGKARSDTDVARDLVIPESVKNVRERLLRRDDGNSLNRPEYTLWVSQLNDHGN